ncbi:Uncharacterised protein [Mycobacterium tuberculosis]|nr:Uncharacterised protein [Mycobacterium tuberculosis]
MCKARGDRRHGRRQSSDRSHRTILSDHRPRSGSRRTREQDGIFRRSRGAALDTSDRGRHSRCYTGIRAFLGCSQPRRERGPGERGSAGDDLHQRYHGRAQGCATGQPHLLRRPGHLAKRGFELGHLGRRRNHLLAAAGDAHRWTVVDTYLPDARRVVCHRRREYDIVAGDSHHERGGDDVPSANASFEVSF